MKKILFLLLGLTIAVGAAAGTGSWRDHRPAPKQASWPTLTQQAKPNAMFRKSGKPAKLRGNAPEAIYEQPEGTQVNYSREGSCYVVYNNTVAEQSGYISVVYAPDGSTVYLKGLNSGISPNCWVQGTIANGRITIPLGQYTFTYFENGEYWYGLVLTWGSMESANSESTPVFTPDFNVTEVTYLIDGDNLVLENSQAGDADGRGAEGLGGVWDDDGYCAAMEWETVFTPSDVVIPQVIDYIPQGDMVFYDRSAAYLATWLEDLDYLIYKSAIIYAPDGETVYFQDPVAFNNSGTWVQGTISGNTIHVPLGQYTYFDYTSGEGALLAWGTASALTEDNYYFAFTPDENVTEYTYSIDGDNIYLDNSSIGKNGDGATGLALVTNDESNPEFIMEFISEFSPYVEPTVIYDQPEGELMTYKRLGISCDHYGNATEQEGDVNIVFAPDGETVYIQDIIYPIYEGSWVRGTIEGNKVHVPLRQYLYWNDEYNYGITLTLGQLFYNNAYWVDYDLSVTEVTFTISGNDFILDNTYLGPNNNLDGAMVLAAVYTDDMSWMVSCNLLTELIAQPTIIDEEPEGNLVTYIRTGYYMDEYGWPQLQVGTVDFVYADDGKTVYIQNLAYTCYEQKSVWVKGTIADGKIHVPVGQYLWFNEDEDVARVLAWGTFTPGVYEYVFTPDPNATEITLSINGDIISLDNSYYSGHSDQVTIGLTSMNPYENTAWSIEYGTTFIPYFEAVVITDQPEGDMVTYLRTGTAICEYDQLNKKGKGNRNVELVNLTAQRGEAFVVYAPDGETVYLKDPMFCGRDYNRESWVQGTLSADGTKITVPLGQYVSWYEDYSYGDRLVWGSTSVEAPDPENPYTEQKVIFTPDHSVTEVTYTIENGCLFMDNTQGCTYEEFNELVDQYYNDVIDEDAFNAALAPMLSATGLAHIDMAGGWTGEINWGTKYANMHPTTLPDPEILSWSEAHSEWEETYLEVLMPEYDTDGLPIFEEALSYSIYTDNDQLFTFEADKYNIDEDKTEITYDDWMNHDWYLNITRPCFKGTWTAADGFTPFFNWRIGIQFHYTVDGVKNSTGITYIEVYEKPEDPVKPGDVNGDDLVNITDVILLINYLSNGDIVVINEENADFNDDTFINITDVIQLINFLSNN